MNIAILSGELSGDLIGGALAWELRRLVPDVVLWGLGSQSLHEAGVELVADSAAWSAISVTEAIPKVPVVFRVLRKVQRLLHERRPDVVVLVDFGAFNVRVAQTCKTLGLKVCYYFPPGAWRRNDTRGAELATLTDLLATPFEWSAERWRRQGAKAIWVGHPLLERVHPLLSRGEFVAQFGMDAARPIIGLLPGSRRQEVAHLMPTMLSAARRIYKSVPDAQFVVGIAPSISPEMLAGYLSGHGELRDRLSELWHEFAQEAESKVLKRVTRTASALAPQRTLVTAGGVLVPENVLKEELEARRREEHRRARTEEALPPTVLAKGLTYDVMAHSDLLLICSGTATLEAAIVGTPMIILYRGSRLMEFEYKLRGLRKKIPHIGLPNILADRRIVPELIQEQATPEAIAERALPLLNDIETRHRTRQALLSVRDALGTPGASERTARLVIALARGQTLPTGP